MKKVQVERAVTIANRLLSFDNLPHVTGLLFATHAFKPLLVPVPFHRGFSHRRRVFDLHVTLYVPEDCPDAPVSELRFLNSKFTLAWDGQSFNYFLVHPRRQIQRPFDNFLVMWLAQDDTVPADGDILLVKTDNNNRVHNIEEYEIDRVQEAMIAFIVEEWYDETAQSDSEGG
ncbi:hypothetical protein BKA70DRAFT_1431673 [Coprinopsis sp. MPI-PUGE-AT-0042]|nr:hypothetical protein BKA70DRAFT_1431673 [Coprinopsis sp. MPI-PUGE-AT-0042]